TVPACPIRPLEVHPAVHSAINEVISNYIVRESNGHICITSVPGVDSHKSNSVAFNQIPPWRGIRMIVADGNSAVAEQVVVGWVQVVRHVGLSDDPACIGTGPGYVINR